MVLHLPLKTMPDFPLVLHFIPKTQVTSRIFRTINTISHLAGLYVKTMWINGRQKIPQRELKLTIAPTSPFSPFSPGGPGKPCKKDKYSLVQRKKGHMRRTELHITKESTAGSINVFCSSLTPSNAVYWIVILYCRCNAMESELIQAETLVVNTQLVKEDTYCN